MSYSNQTTHYGIPLPTSGDLVNLLDWNQSSEDIDTAIYGAAEAAQQAGSDIQSVAGDVSQLQTDLGSLQSDVTAIDGRVTSLEQTSGSLEDDIEDIADMITAKEVPSAQSDQRILVDEWFRYNGVLYVCTVQIEIGDTIVPNVNCRATNIESEMASGGGGSSEASDVSLAPIAGMSATNVQEGISELNADLTELERRGFMPDLDFANPLHTFSTGNLSFTATKDCYLCGSTAVEWSGALTNATVSVDGTIIASANVYGAASYGSYSSEFVGPILIKNGSTVTVTNAMVGLHILDVIS